MPPRDRQPPSQEVATVNEDAIQRFGGSYVVARKDSFERLLPEGVDGNTFVGLAMAALFKAPKTAEVAMRNPESLIIALRECAGLGLMPGTDEYALTVRKGAVAGIIQYQGHIKRMYNFGTVQSVHAEVIVRGERFIKQDPLPPIHDVADWNMRDTRVDIPPTEAGGYAVHDSDDEPVPNLTGAYAFAMLDGGRCSRVVHMGRAEIMRHRAKAEMYAIWDGPFGASMWLKTVVHELEKWVPKSSAFQAEQQRVQVAMADAPRPRERTAAPRETPVDAVTHDAGPFVPPTPDNARGAGSDRPTVVPAEPQFGRRKADEVRLPSDDAIEAEWREGQTLPVQDPPVPEREWPDVRRPGEGQQ